MMLKVYEYVSVILVFLLFFFFCCLPFLQKETTSEMSSLLPWIGKPFHKSCLFLNRLAYCGTVFPLKLIEGKEGDYYENGICFL